MQLKRTSRQRGFALLDALVALTVLAVAVLALLGMQLRTLVEARTSAHRAHAIRLIDDLAERLRANPLAAAHADAYLGSFAAAPTATTRCDQQPCDGAALAAWDIAEWRDAVAHDLPRGQAAVLAPPLPAGADGTSRRQLKVVIGWRANERRPEGASATQAAALRSPFEVDSGGAAIDCPPDLICHVGHVQP